MQGGAPHIIVHIDTESPIEIGDFVGVFTSVASQYQKFIRANYPELSDDADIYVREVRPGSIEADLIPWALATLAPLVSTMENILIVDTFVRTYGDRLRAYLSPGGRDPQATSGDLKDFYRQVAAIAKDRNGSVAIESATYEDGRKQVRAAIKFNTTEARKAIEQIEAHQRELEYRANVIHERVLMVFRQSNIKDVEVGKRSGERVVIEAISKKELALIYASELAEKRIKHEIREADDNVYKKGFIVDVSVEMHDNRPVAYRVTNIHQVVDLPDD